MKKFLFGLMIMASLLSVPVFAISDEQIAVIKENCDTIKEDLKNVQHADSRTRVYLGRHYETVLSKFITPLNMRLVENNLSDTDLISNQNDFTKAKNTFAIDYVEYQKTLEELTSVDCKAEPSKFYDGLVKVRSKRKIVANDVLTLRKLASDQVKLVTKLKEGL